MKLKVLALLVVGVVLLSTVSALIQPTPVWAASVTISASKDTYLDDLYQTTNFGTLSMMKVGELCSYPGSPGVKFRSIIEFEEPWGGGVPSGATITSAYLQLYCYAPPYGARTMHAQRLLRVGMDPWLETQATWVRYIYGDNWAVLGAGQLGVDYTASGQASATVTASASWINWDVTTQVQWAQTNEKDIAVRIVDSSESCSYEAWFRTREYSDSAYRPRLVINYNSPLVPSVTTVGADGISTDEATCYGNIDSVGSSAVNRRGIKYGLTQVDTWDEYETGTFGTGGYSEVLSGLSKNTTYWYRAYATNTYGTGYGAWLSFTTATGAPIVETISSYVTGCGSGGCIYAYLTGNITSEGDSNVFKRGFEYGTSTLDPDTWSEMGSYDVGSYTSDSILVQGGYQYYYRAFAENSQGKGYGEWLQFTVCGCIAIFDVNDLQDMQNNLTACYYLANDIDASNTTNWNWDGVRYRGFDPIGRSWTQHLYLIPEYDWSYSGCWTTYPNDGVIWSKLTSNDADTSYVESSTADSYELCGVGVHTINPNADITQVDLRATVKKTSGAATCQMYITIGAINYLVGDPYTVTTDYYQFRAVPTTCPATDLPWTGTDINNIDAYGLYILTASGPVRCTYHYFGVRYFLPFSGSLDGKGYEITDLYINRPDKPGANLEEATLFGCTNNAVITDVVLRDANITGNYDSSGLIDYALNTTITNCAVVDISVTGDDSAGLVQYLDASVVDNCWSSGVVTATNGAAGGLVDGTDASSITNSYSTCTVTATSDDAGGLVGSSWTSSTIADCYATGDVISTSAAGGLIGTVDDSSVQRSYATGTATLSDAGYAGGLFGYAIGTGTISQCYATGNVDVSTFWAEAGGLIGEVGETVDIEDCYSRGDVLGGPVLDEYLEVGGLIGDIPYSSGATVQRCHSTGTVPTDAYITGGSIGYRGVSCNVSNIFWDTTTSEMLDGVGDGSETGVTGANTTAMKSISTFNATWDIEPYYEPLNDGYPFLHWQVGDSPTIWYIYGEAVPECMPDLVTYAATSIGLNNATLNGALLNLCNYTLVDCYFQWGLTTSYSYSTSPKAPKASTGSFNKLIIGLSPNTTYHFRALGDYDEGTAYGNDRTFRTLAEGGGGNETNFTLIISSTDGGNVTIPGEGSFEYAPDTVVNLTATADTGYSFALWTGNVDTITDVSSATTNITMNGDYAIVANFVSGGSGLYSLITSSTDGGSVTVPGEGVYLYPAGTVVDIVAQADSGYWFQSWTGDTGTVANVLSYDTTITMSDNYSIVADFIEEEAPPEGAPTVVTGNATGVTISSASLHGALTSLGDYSEAYVFLQYGLNTSYGTSTPEQLRVSVGSFSATVSGLTSNTTYHFRAVARYGSYVYGNDTEFTTSESEEPYEPGYEYYPCGDEWKYEAYETGDNDTASAYGAYWFSQTFTPEQAFKIDSVRLKLARVGTSGALTVSIKNVDSQGRPTGPDLVSAAYSGVGTSTGWYEIEFEPYRLETKMYAIVVRAVAGDGANYIGWQFNSAGNYTVGTYVESSNSGVSWITNDDYDFMFETFGTTVLCIMDVKVFSDYLKEGDWLITVHYLNEFPPYYTQVKDVSNLFVLQFVRGTTVVAQVGVPLWGYMPASFYLSPQLAGTLEWGEDYSVVMRGRFAPYPSSTYALIPEDWLGEDLTRLDTWVLGVADQMSSYYDADMTVYTENRKVLSDAGSVFFAIGIPMLANIRPNVFLNPNLWLVYEEEDWERAYEEQLARWRDTLGPDIVDVAERTGALFSLQGNQVALAVFGGVWVVAIAGVAAFAGSAAIIVSIPFLLIGFLGGVIPLALAAVLASLFLLAFVLYTWISRS